MNTLQIFAILAVLVVLCFLIAIAARRWTKPITADTVRATQLREAGVQSLQWAAQAEHATAMSAMYAGRVRRLSEEQAS